MSCTCDCASPSVDVVVSVSGVQRVGHFLTFKLDLGAQTHSSANTSSIQSSIYFNTIMCAHDCCNMIWLVSCSMHVLWELKEKV